MNKTTLVVILVILIVALGIWWGVSAPSGPAVEEGEEPVGLEPAELPAAAAVRTHLSETLGIPRENVVILSAVENEWPDGCLGLAEPDEMCTQAIVPGYEVSASTEIGGSVMVFRTNEDGSILRQQ